MPPSASESIRDNGVTPFPGINSKGRGRNYGLDGYIQNLTSPLENHPLSYSHRPTLLSQNAPFCKQSLLRIETIPINQVDLRSNYEMLFVSGIIIALATVVSAIPSIGPHAREQGLCAAVGDGCDFDGSACCHKAGFAFCERNSRKVVFHGCKTNACAVLKGKASCVEVQTLGS